MFVSVYNGTKTIFLYLNILHRTTGTNVPETICPWHVSGPVDSLAGGLFFGRQGQPFMLIIKQSMPDAFTPTPGLYVLIGPRYGWIK